MENSRTQLLRQIKDEVVNLKESSLCQERIRNKVFPVIGEGSHYAKIMFIGEAPGKNEAETGRPFCGAAGRILDELLALVGIARADVYITNIVKDRPPNNRDPFPEEIFLYAPFLDRQIEIIQPEVIVTLGRHSLGYIFEKFGLGGKLESIGKIHGSAYEVTSAHGVIKIIPFFHPAAALYDGSKKEDMVRDFQILKSFLGSPAGKQSQT